MSSAFKVLSNSGFQFMGKILTAGLGVLSIKILSQYLGSQGYGDYVTVFVFLSFFGIASDFGFFTLAVREMSKDRDKIPFIIGNVLGLRLFLAVSSMSIAILVGFIIPYFSETWRVGLISKGVTIAALGTVFSIMSGTVSSLLQVHYKMYYETLGLTVNKIIGVSYMAYVAYLGYVGRVEEGFYQVLWGGVVGSLVMLCITFSVSRRLAPLTIRFDFVYWKKMFIEALPFGVALILNVFYFKEDILLLGFLRGSEEVGIYAVPMKILEVFYFLPLYFMNSMLPLIIAALHADSSLLHGAIPSQTIHKVTHLIQLAFNFLLMCAAAMVAGGLVLAYPIIFAISKPEFLSRLNEGFYGSDIAFQILLFAMFFSFMNALWGMVLIALNKQKRLMVANFWGVILNLILNLAFIPLWGFRGSAVASVISAFVVVLLTYSSVKHALSLKLSFIPALKILFSAASMGVIIYILRDPTYDLLQNANLALLIPLGAVIYLAMLFLTGVVTKEMLKVLMRKEQTVVSSPHTF